MEYKRRHIYEIVPLCDIAAKADDNTNVSMHFSQ